MSDKQLVPAGTNKIAVADDIDMDVIERVVIMGDLEKLSAKERMSYYMSVCNSLGLNPATQPFAYVKMKQGGLKLYARKDCAEQLRRQYRISISLEEPSLKGDVWYQKAVAKMPSGRRDEAIGAVAVGNQRGESLANAIMKCETKAKRRVTLSICGLGFVNDESEFDGLQDAQIVGMGEAHGQAAAPEQKVVLSGHVEQAPTDPAPVAVPVSKSQEEHAGLEPEGSPECPPNDMFPPFEDGADPPPRPRGPAPESLAPVFITAIAGAETGDELRVLRDRIKALVFEEDEQSALMAAYKNSKRNLLAKGAW